MSLDLVQHLFRGVKLWGCVEGDSYPADFIPELIKYYRQGKLPGKIALRLDSMLGLLTWTVDQMVKYYKAEDFKAALHVRLPPACEKAERTLTFI